MRRRTDNGSANAIIGTAGDGAVMPCAGHGTTEAGGAHLLLIIVSGWGQAHPLASPRYPLAHALNHPSGRPLPGEYADYAQADIEQVQGVDAVSVFEALADQTLTLLQALPEARLEGIRYAPSKWTLKDVIGHVVDDERIFAYRALCLARGEAQSLPGFDEKLYATNAEAEMRPWREILCDYRAVRAASVALFRGFSPAQWTRSGEVNGYRATARGLAFHIAGHELHHVRLLQDRYFPLLA